MRLFCLLVVLLASGLVSAQEPTLGPIIREFGPTFALRESDIPLQENASYRAVFDVAVDLANAGEENPKLVSVARFLNMHGRSGVSPEHMQLVVVLHGEALKNALTHSGYQERYSVPNPNVKLLQDLHAAGVRLIACGQSLGFRKVPREALLEPVEVGLSAMTVLTTLQMRGFCTVALK